MRDDKLEARSPIPKGTRVLGERVQVYIVDDDSDNSERDLARGIR